MFWTGLASSGSMLWRVAQSEWPLWQSFRKSQRSSARGPASSRVLVCASVALLGAVLLAGTPDGVAARETVPSIFSVDLAQLPPQAKETHQRILAGGPFPYPKDGIVFGNREQQLPRQARGYYREYTVSTPGAKNRGARRIVCGGDPPIKPSVCFYTDDHYASFRRIAP